MDISDRKRSLLLDSFDLPTKRFKEFDVSEEELSDCELQIDLDSNAINENFNDLELYSDVSWKRPVFSDYLNVTLSSGHHCYVKLSDSEVDINNLRQSASNHTASQDYYRLLDEAENILKRKKENNVIVSQRPMEMSKTLWVTKYSPKQYTDLLSSEFANRNLLSWLKSWDKHVFNKDTKFIEKLKSKTTSKDDDFLQINPKDGMPSKKVVLLAGPPGLGKTTLAEIIAKHCGYFAIEVNASDDRSPESFRNKIQDLSDTQTSTSQSSAKGQLMKPRCLIFDEIDGAPGSAIAVLVNAINASTKSDKESVASKKKQKAPVRVNRPIICICNDLYSASLKQLRPLCYTIKIMPPDFHVLLQRLSDICKMENLECDRTALTNIIDSSNRDIRSCLNTLQFLKNQGFNSVTNAQLSSINVGQKDIEINSFKIWQHIFTEPNLQKPYLMNNDNNTSILNLRLKNILKIAHSTGDFDRIIGGIHENYLSLVRFKDIYLQGMVQAAEWMVFNDLSNKQINSYQIYEMFKYKQYIVPFFHLSFASTAILPSSISWPTSEANAHFKHQKLRAIYDSFVGNQHSIFQWIQSKQEVVKYILPNLINIIQPTQLRPINAQLFSCKEKITLQNTVDIMISTGLNYLQEKVGDLQYQYILTPNIEEIVTFNLSETARKELTYATKQLIANEINREKIRKSDVRRNKSSDNACDVLTEFSQNRIGFIMQKANEMKSKTTINYPKKSGNSFSFYLGPKSLQISKDEPNEISKILNQSVWFKYKEGFSNFVKRPVKMKDL